MVAKILASEAIKSQEFIQISLTYYEWSSIRIKSIILLIIIKSLNGATLSAQAKIAHDLFQINKSKKNSSLLFTP